MGTYFPPTAPGFGKPGPFAPNPKTPANPQNVVPHDPMTIAQNSPAGLAIARQQAAKALAIRSAALNARYGLGGRTALTKTTTKGRGSAPAPWTGKGGATTPVQQPLPNGQFQASDAPFVNPAGAVPGVPGQYQNLFNSVLQQALKLYSTPNAAANSLINPNAILSGIAGSEINPTQVGNDAGLGYDAQIAQLGRNYGTTQNQNAQDIADIRNWFQQAANTQSSGAADNAKAFAQQLAGQQDAASAFMNALGGSASPGAAGIANAADIASAGLRGEGLANTNFDNNMKGIVALDQAQQLQNEQTAGTNRLQSLMDQIAQAQGQKSAAVAQAKDNAQQALFGQKSSLAQLKANLVGNLFNEKQGLRQQKLSELGGLSNTILGTALAGPQIQGAELNNQNAAASAAGRTIANMGSMAQIKAFIAQNGAAKNDISSAPLSVRNGILGQYSQKGGPFVNAVGDLKMPPNAIKSALRTQLTSSLGLQPGPGLESFLNGLVQAIVTPLRVKNYDKAHKTNYFQQGGYAQ